MTMTLRGGGGGGHHKISENEMQFGTPVTFTVIQQTIGGSCSQNLPCKWFMMNITEPQTDIINVW